MSADADKKSDARLSELDKRTSARFIEMKTDLHVMNGKIEASAAVGNQALDLSQEAMQNINALTEEVKEAKPGRVSQ